MTALLATSFLATGGASGLWSDVAPYLAGLGGLLVIGAVVIILVRRSVRGTPGGTAHGFTLEELRELHRSGQLSDAEFRHAKEAMIRQLKPSEPPSGTREDTSDSPPSSDAAHADNHTPPEEPPPDR